MLLFSAQKAVAAYSNYNSVLIGQEAAGLGGAYTALYGDSSATAFYNPAAMTKMAGSSFSANVSTFQKLDTDFGGAEQFSTSPTRINKGFFEPVPSSVGSVISYGHFALGFSLLIPDFSTFSGEIESSADTTSFLNFTDESLWVGGSLALNISPSISLGASIHYTARKFQRSVSDQSTSGANFITSIEEKNFTHNSIVYVLGLFHQIDKYLTLGLSVRPPSIPISGEGTFFQSTTNTGINSRDDFFSSDLTSETRVPMKISLGIAYKEPKKYTISADVTYHGKETYQDLDLEVASDAVIHKATINFAAGIAYYYKPWLAFRAGYFSNLSSHDEIDNVGSQRVGDHIDMHGISANMTFHSSENTQFTIGGYWTGGEGESVQQIGQSLTKIGKSLHIYSMLVGSSYKF